MINVYRSSVGKPEGKRSLGKLRRRCEDIIKINLRDTGCKAVGWIELAQNEVQ
jgi:hypothetical protein